MRLACVGLLCVFACGGDDAETCERIVGPGTSVRDPATGTCVSVEPPGCDDDASGDGPAPVDDRWPPCMTVCNGVLEEECMVLDGCRAIYREAPGERAYLDCWAVNTDGPIQGIGCETDDANECASRDDCVAVHDSSGMFRRCDVEPKSTLGECTFARCTPAE